MSSQDLVVGARGRRRHGSRFTSLSVTRRSPVTCWLNPLHWSTKVLVQGPCQICRTSASHVVGGTSRCQLSCSISNMATVELVDRLPLGSVGGTERGSEWPVDIVLFFYQLKLCHSKTSLLSK